VLIKPKPKIALSGYSFDVTKQNPDDGKQVNPLKPKPWHQLVNSFIDYVLILSPNQNYGINWVIIR